jgi:hypothetical protein
MLKPRNVLDDLITLAVCRDADPDASAVGQAAIDAAGSAQVFANDGFESTTNALARPFAPVGVWGSFATRVYAPGVLFTVTEATDRAAVTKSVESGAPFKDALLAAGIAVGAGGGDSSPSWRSPAAPRAPDVADGMPATDSATPDKSFNKKALATTQPQLIDFKSGPQGVFGSDASFTFKLPSFLYQHYAFGIGAGFDGFGIYAGASVTGGVKGSVALSLGQFTPNYPVTIDPGVVPFVQDGQLFSIDPSLISTNDAAFSLSLPQANASLDFGLEPSAGVTLSFPSLRIGVTLPFVGFVGYTLHVPSVSVGFNAGNIYKLGSNTSISIPGDGTVTLSELQAKTVSSTPTSGYGDLPTLSLSGNTDPFFVANTDLVSILAKEVPDPFAALQGNESFYGLASLDYKLLSLPLSGSLWLNENVTLTPVTITETVTMQGGKPQVGTIGQGFTFTAPTSGSGILPISITFGLEFQVHTALYLDGNIKLTLEGPQASASILGVSAGIGPLGNFNLLDLSGTLFELYSDTFSDTLTAKTTVDVQYSDTTVSKTVKSQSGAVMLTKPGTNLTVTSAGTVTGAAYGVETGTLSAAQVTNFGLITATGNGVDLQEGGTVDVEAGGRITATGGAPGAGVLATGAAINAVVNAGAITGFSQGLELDGGSLKNETGARISASSLGVSIANAQASIVNNGYIGAATAVSLAKGGSVYNALSGVIAGSKYGVYSGGALTLENQCTLTGGGMGVRAIAGGTVTNLDGGYIHGGAMGVVLTGGAGQIVTNGVGATISGATYGVYLTGANVTLVDYGLIAGGKDAVVLNGTQGNTLVLAPGAQLQGNVRLSTNDFNNTISLSAGSGGVGTLTGLGGAIPFQNGEISIAAGAAWDISGDFNGVWINGLNKTDQLDDTAIAYSPGERAHATLVNKGDGIYFEYIAIHAAGSPTTTVGEIRVSDANGPFGYGAVPAYGLTVTAGAAGGVDVGFVQQKLTTVSANQGAVIIGPNGIFGPNVTIDAGVTLSSEYYGVSQGDAVQASYERASVTNYGVIQQAVEFRSGGLVSNEAGGTIYGGVLMASYSLSKSYTADQANTVSLTNAGVISGGVQFRTSGTVTNLAGGQITGVLNGLSLYATSSVINAGTISGGGRSALRMSYGGFVYNGASGLLTSHTTYFFGVDISNGYATVVNRGTISSTANIGVFLSDGGLVVNQGGAILGEADGVKITGAAGDISNAGYISGIRLSNGGTIVNAAGATIAAGSGYGVSFYNQSGPVGAYLHNIGRIDGVLAFGDDTIVNEGLIDGVGVVAGAAGGVTVTNAGTIQGSGGTAVKFISASDRLIAEAGSQFGGALVGGGGALELGGVGAETITGLGGGGELSGTVTASFSGFGTYLIDPGVTLTLTGLGTIAQGKALTDDGSLIIGAGATLNDYGDVAIGGSLTLAGSVVGLSGDGIDLLTGGAVTLSGSISGAVGVNATSGSDYQGGSGGAGIGSSSSGTITNNSGMIAGGSGGSGAYYFGPGGGGAGGAGVALGSGRVASNGGTIAGGSGGGGVNNYDVGGSGGTGGAGVVLGGAGTVANMGGIILGGGGGAGGNGGYFGGSGGSGGAGVVLGGDGTVTNTGGTIAGGAAGNGGSGAYGAGSVGVGGDGVFLAAGGILINGGAGATNALITGAIGVCAGGGGAATVINFGTIQGVGGTAVQFNSAADRLIVESGSTWVGAISGGGGTLELASGTGTINGLGGAGTLSGAVAMTFGGFASYMIDAGASWTLASGQTLAANQTLTNAGILSGGLALGAASDRLVVVSGSVLNGAVTGDGGVLELAGGAGTISGLGASGTLSGAVAMTFSGFGAYAIDAGGAWTLKGGHTLAANQTLINAGTLSGALALGSASDRLILASGSIVNGTVTGGGGVLELAGGSGTITGLGATGTLSGAAAMTFKGFGSYTIDAGGAWTLTGANKLGAGQALTVAGLLIDNGTVSGAGAAGVTLSAGGSVDNAAAASLISGTIGVYAGAGGAATVTTFGTIKGTGGTAVQFASASDRLIAEAGSVFTGAVKGGGGALELAGGTGTITGLGGAGKLSGAEAMTFSGFGAYAIDAGASWTLAGASALGPSRTLAVSGSLINSGTINSSDAAGGAVLVGGSLTNGGAILGTGVTGVTLSGGSLTNAAGKLISGGVGVYAGASGASTVTNLGTVQGTGGTAVRFASAGDRLIAEARSTWTGAVKGGGGTLELANGSGTITGLGGAGALSGAEAMTFSGFGTYAIDAGANWKLATGALAANQTLANAGTLSGTLVLAAASDRFVAQAGSTVKGSVAGGLGVLELAGGGETISGVGAIGTLSGAAAMTFSGFGSYEVDAGVAATLIGLNALEAGQTMAVAGALTNAGTIGAIATALDLSAGGSVDNSMATSVISGAIGIYAGPAGAATVTNYGAIDGTGGVAVRLASASDRLIVEGGASFVGSVQGGGGTLELASGVGAIGELGSAFIGFGTYTVAVGGVWTLYGGNALAAGRSLSVAGAVSVASAAAVTGAAGGAGGYGATGDAGGTALTLSSASASVSNAGLISGGQGGVGGEAVYAGTGGAGGAGVILAAGGGAISNGGSIAGGAGGRGGYTPDLGSGAGGSGGAGVWLAAIGSVTNTGAITGGAGGESPASPAYSGHGGQGGAGVSAYSGLITNNGGTITGGAGGNAVYGSYYGGGGGFGGAGVAMSGGGTVVNSFGAILGGAAGVPGGSPGGGRGPAGIAGEGVSLAASGMVINGGVTSPAALIEGLVGVYAGAGGAATVTNWGAVDGTGGISVQFKSASDRLIAEAGSTWIGSVQGGGGTLELGGGTGTVTGLGSTGTLSGAEAMTFSGFGSYAIDAGGSWALTGATVLASQALTVAGTLTIADKASLTVQGVVANSGRISLAATTHTTSLVIGTPGATLNGHGTVALGTNALDTLTGAAAAATLTNVDNTISGGD